MGKALENKEHLINEIRKYRSLGLRNKQILQKLNISKSSLTRLEKKGNISSSHRYYYKSLDYNDISNIIACTIGDGCLYKPKNKGCFVYGKIEQIVDNLDYLQEKQRLLGDFVVNKTIHVGRTARKITNSKGKIINCKETRVLQIKASPYLEELYNIQYPNKIKSISTELIKYFSDRTLAYKYFDDGCYISSRNTYRISMGILDDQSVNNFMEWIKNTFDINCSFQTSLGYKLIYIKADSHDKFEKILLKYMVKSMLYKIKNGEVKQGELLETPEMDNQQPSLERNLFEGSTTNNRPLAA